MKNLLYIVLGLVLISSCRSIEKMVDQGQYDEAILFAAEKLAGKKNKKTKYVKGLEEAFAKITRHEMSLIERLDGPDNPANWDKIHDIALKIQNRQNRISAFLPLISKEGYQADFEFVKTNIIINKAAEGATAHHYSLATEELEKARLGDKSAARRAYNDLKNAESYVNGSNDIHALKAKAVELGKNRILVSVENKSNSVIPIRLEEMLEDIYVNDLNTLWNEYATEFDNNNIDYKANLIIRQLHISPEREFIERHTDTKKVEDGWRYVLDKKGNVKKDSLGNDIKKPKFRTIRAQVTEIRRKKSALVNGELRFNNFHSKKVVQKIPITVEALFNDFTSKFKGNRNALCDKSRNSLKGRPVAFPNDFEMIIDATEKLKVAFKDALYDLNV
ncbi:MAG: hypothetical protein KJO50_09450 [Bacteroidia bacterium]|nr:hypothetical protein [Bacteroidia bacterium]